MVTLSRCDGRVRMKVIWFAFAIIAAHQRQTSPRCRGLVEGGGRGGEEGREGASCIVVTGDGGQQLGHQAQRLRGRLLGSVMRAPITLPSLSWRETVAGG